MCRKFHPLIQTQKEQNDMVEAFKMGIVFFPKWLWKDEKFYLLHSSRSEPSPQWLNFVIAIPPTKNHYPQWNQIPQTLIYFVFVSVSALLLGVNLTLTYQNKLKCYHGWSRSKTKQALCVWFLPALKKWSGRMEGTWSLLPLAGKEQQTGISVQRTGPGISQKSFGKRGEGKQVNPHLL